MKKILFALTLLLFSCDNSNKEIVKDKEIDTIPQINKKIMSFDEFEQIKQKKRVMAFSAFWAGMTNKEMMKSLNFLLDNNEIFIDSTCLFERFKNNEYWLNAYKRRLVNNNYIDPTYFDAEFFSNNDDFFESSLFTSWLNTEHKQFKVYSRFIMDVNPLNKDIVELSCVSLSIFDADENDFKDLVSVYSEKYGAPEIKKVLSNQEYKEKIMKEINNTHLGWSYSTLIESFVLDEMKITIEYTPRLGNLVVPCNINESKGCIDISYSDLLYDNLIDKEKARILKIQEDKALKEEEEMDKIKKENELYRKKKLNNRI